jgi:pyruvate,orthophosphate dikinase
MHAAEGILTARGGMTSHAAVVARGMGTPCVSGAGGLRIDAQGGTLVVGLGATLKAGDVITIDGSTGEVLLGAVAMLQPELSGDFGLIMEWADATPPHEGAHQRRNPRRCRAARAFGAEGIGLCRTEHMFFDGDRITAMREMILAETEGGRRAALAKLLPMQRGTSSSCSRSWPACR